MYCARLQVHQGGLYLTDYRAIFFDRLACTTRPSPNPSPNPSPHPSPNPNPYPNPNPNPYPNPNPNPNPNPSPNPTPSPHQALRALAHHAHA